jgi:multiple sugar transport system substrate-binding protein
MRKMIIAIMVLFFGFFILVGCDKTTEELKIVSVGNFGTNWEQVFVRDKIIAEFEKEFNVRVTLDVVNATDGIKKIKTEQDSGEYVSDLVFVHSGEMPTFITKGYVQDITADVAYTDRTIDKENHFTSVTNVGETRYFVPVSSDAYLTVANKKALVYLPEGADVNNLTWEEFAEWAYNIKNGANNNVGVGAKTMFPSQAGYNLIYIMGGMGLAYGAGFVDVDSEHMKQAYELMLQMAIDEVFVNEQKNYSTAVDKMKDETAWLSFQHMTQAGEILRYKPDNFVIAAPPLGDAGRGSIIGAWGLGVLDGAPHKATALKFIEYMTRKSVNYKYCTGLGGVISPIAEVIDDVKAVPETARTTSERIMLMGIDVMEHGLISGVPSADYTDWRAVKGVYETLFEKILLKSQDDYLRQIPIAKSQILGLLKTFPQEGM